MQSKYVTVKRPGDRVKGQARFDALGTLADEVTARSAIKEAVEEGRNLDAMMMAINAGMMPATRESFEAVRLQQLQDASRIRSAVAVEQHRRELMDQLAKAGYSQDDMATTILPTLSPAAMLALKSQLAKTPDDEKKRAVVNAYVGAPIVSGKAEIQDPATTSNRIPQPMKSQTTTRRDANKALKEATPTTVEYRARGSATDYTQQVSNNQMRQTQAAAEKKKGDASGWAEGLAGLAGAAALAGLGYGAQRLVARGGGPPPGGGAPGGVPPGAFPEMPTAAPRTDQPLTHITVEGSAPASTLARNVGLRQRPAMAQAAGLRHQVIPGIVPIPPPPPAATRGLEPLTVVPQSATLEPVATSTTVSAAEPKSILGSIFNIIPRRGQQQAAALQVATETSRPAEMTPAEKASVDTLNELSKVSPASVEEKIGMLSTGTFVPTAPKPTAPPPGALIKSAPISEELAKLVAAPRAQEIASPEPQRALLVPEGMSRGRAANVEFLRERIIAGEAGQAANLPPTAPLSSALALTDEKFADVAGYLADSDYMTKSIIKRNSDSRYNVLDAKDVQKVMGSVLDTLKPQGGSLVKGYDKILSKGGAVVNAGSDEHKYLAAVQQTVDAMNDLVYGRRGLEPKSTALKNLKTANRIMSEISVRSGGEIYPLVEGTATVDIKRPMTAPEDMPGGHSYVTSIRKDKEGLTPKFGAPDIVRQRSKEVLEKAKATGVRRKVAALEPAEETETTTGSGLYSSSPGGRALDALRPNIRREGRGMSSRHPMGRSVPIKSVQEVTHGRLEDLIYLGRGMPFEITPIHEVVAPKDIMDKLNMSIAQLRAGNDGRAEKNRALSLLDMATNNGMISSQEGGRISKAILAV